jgi:hypothetical protein
MRTGCAKFVMRGYRATRKIGVLPMREWEVATRALDDGKFESYKSDRRVLGKTDEYLEKCKSLSQGFPQISIDDRDRADKLRCSCGATTTASAHAAIDKSKSRRHDPLAARSYDRSGALMAGGGIRPGMPAARKHLRLGVPLKLYAPVVGNHWSPHNKLISGERQSTQPI